MCSIVALSVDPSRLQNTNKSLALFSKAGGVRAKQGRPGHKARPALTAVPG